MDELLRLQRWYAARCDGGWEHRHGVRIETLDNPGWLVKIDLAGTGLEGRPFADVAEGVDPVGHPQTPRWLHCSVRDGSWQGAGDETQLSRLLGLFLDWTEEGGVRGVTSDRPRSTEGFIPDRAGAEYPPVRPPERQGVWVRVRPIVLAVAVGGLLTGWYCLVGLSIGGSFENRLELREVTLSGPLYATATDCVRHNPGLAVGWLGVPLIAIRLRVAHPTPWTAWAAAVGVTIWLLSGLVTVLLYI
jgi:hypothetical protein